MIDIILARVNPKMVMCVMEAHIFYPQTVLYNLIYLTICGVRSKQNKTDLRTLSYNIANVYKWTENNPRLFPDYHAIVLETEK